MALSKKQQKIVDQMVRRVELCREFMNDWMLFNQILTRYPEPGINKAELETQFLKIKSKLARTHKVLRETLADDYNLDGNTMNIVSGATSLEAIYSQSEVAVKKLQQEWHRAFIAINETLGSVDDKRARAEAGEKIFIMAPGGPSLHEHQDGAYSLPGARSDRRIHRAQSGRTCYAVAQRARPVAQIHTATGLSY